MTENDSQESPYRWRILVQGAATSALAVAVPSMAMPVLFNEISKSLELSLVQVGLIWGISSLPGIVTVLLGGAVGDRFGSRRIIILGCILAGLTGAIRGMAWDFWSLMAAVFLMGCLSPFVQMNVFRTIAGWFPRRQLGLANGVLSMGMALGFLIGSLFSAAVLSPWLGGWRNVLYFYGALTLLLSIPWVFTRPEPRPVRAASDAVHKNLGQAISYVASIRNVWLLGLAIMGVGGCIQGVLGYLPLYLRGLGWAPSAADGVLASFHTVSMICVVPIALWSDKLGSRKKVLIASAILITTGVSLLSFVSGSVIWLAVGMAGMVRDGFMAVFTTAIVESEGVGPTYAGTATGMVMVFGGIGNLISPAIGNSLAATAPSLPFLFWVGLMLLGFIGILGAREKSVKRVLATT
jgi:NNP family nitrate/nitrite transporter-like MFS transporter